MSVNKHQLLHDVVSLLSKKYAGKDLSEFLVRFGAQFGDVFAKFDRLYGYREDFSNRFSELILALAEMHLARDPELRDLDRQREEDKDWIMSPNWVATMLYVDRFSKNTERLHAEDRLSGRTGCELCAPDATAENAARGKRRRLCGQ